MNPENIMKKRYQDMTAAELAEATKEFDKPWPGPGLPGRALTATERKQWQRMRDKMNRSAPAKGRPKVGEGVKVISLSVEQSLLRRADALAKKRGVSRAAMVAAGLAAVLEDPKRLVA